ncbi:MAG: glutathione S-transferase family protein [Caulobacterales bacterium]
MGELVLTTYDWVPEPPRGHVRDIRMRWALEEAGLPYSVESTSFHDRGAHHFAHQPFGQTPWLTDGDLSIFESGAIMLHLGGLSEKLMPKDVAGRSAVTEWVFGSLNSIEMASVPWSIFHFSGFSKETQEWKFLDGWVNTRMQRMEKYLAAREWLTEAFSIADILMVDVLRLIDRFDGLANYLTCKAYVARGVARPAFQKAHADQLAHFAAADAAHQR